jgi:hypothetical protein
MGMEVSHHETRVAGLDAGEATTAALIPIPDNPQAVLEAAPDRATFVLIALDRARQWLVSASSIEEVNELRARAEAVRVYTRQAELGKEAENAAAEIRLRAERRIGELLKEMQLAPGRPRKRSSTTTISGGNGRPARAGHDAQPASLGQLGVSKDASAAFQRIAEIPEDEFEGRLTAAKERGRVSRSAVLRDEDAEEGQRAREEFDAFVASVTPPDYDPTFDNEAVEDVGHLDGACEDVLELAARRSAEVFADRYHRRRTIPDLLPRIEAAAIYLTTVHRHLTERIG